MGRFRRGRADRTLLLGRESLRACEEESPLLSGLHERRDNPQARRADTAPARRFRVGALIALAVAVALVAWLVTRDNGDSATPPNVTAVSPSQIKTLAASVGYAVFWSDRSRATRTS